MKTGIFYASKTGGTEQCAKSIQANLSMDSELINLKKVKDISLDAFDRVIVGTPIYMGKIQPSVKKFLNKKHQILLKKELHFFTCGMAQQNESVGFLKNQISPELFVCSKQTEHLGCEIHLENLNFLFRAIIKKIIEDEKPTMGLNEEKIKFFAKNVG